MNTQMIKNLYKELSPYEPKNKIYTKKQIDNYLKTTPLPNPDLLEAIVHSNIDYYTKLSNKSISTRIAELVGACKLFNKFDLIQHTKYKNADKEIFALSMEYIAIFLGKFWFSNYRYTFEELFLVYDEKFWYVKSKELKGYTKAYIRNPKYLPYLTGNKAYAPNKKVYKAIKDYLKSVKENPKKALEDYKKVYNKYLKEKITVDDIIARETLKENKIIELKETKDYEINPCDFYFLKIDNIENELETFINEIEEKIKYFLLKIISDPHPKWKFQLKENQRVLKDANELKKYISDNTLIIPKNIVDTKRDYHFITYFSKKFRKEFFEKRLFFFEYDVNNMAYKAIANELEMLSKRNSKLNKEFFDYLESLPEKTFNKLIQAEEKILKKEIYDLLENENYDEIWVKQKINKLYDKIEFLKENSIEYFKNKISNIKDSIYSILYYSRYRNDIINEILDSLNIKSKSKREELKSIIKIEFLSVLFGKKEPVKLLEDERDQYVFEEYFSYIQQDIKELKRKYYYLIKPFFELKYGFQSNTRNFLSKLFMSIESEIMNKIQNELNDYQMFRLHDAIFIQSHPVETKLILDKINNILDEYQMKSKCKTGLEIRKNYLKN